MKLYYSPGACSMASHISLLEIDQPVELVKTDIRAKKTQDGRDFREINRLGYVPALELDGGEILTENGAILPYIAGLRPGTLAPTGDALSDARLHEVLGFLSSELHKSFSPFFGPLEGAAREAALEKLRSRIGHVEYLLGDGRDYLFGDQFSVADAYAFVILSWTRAFDISLDEWPSVAAFVRRVAQRPAVIKAMAEEGLLETA
ncbi:MAG: glutathione S-transferase C-terminal domain-containing protein [Sphingomonas sp.]|nr:glutathione S-transferase C-terminal domain-containing protein [Sphingomonas sp.]